jgi:hypothetical protein
MPQRRPERQRKGLPVYPEPIAGSPQLSIVIGTSDAGPEFDRCFASVREDARTADAEIIVVDGRPDARERIDDGVIWVAAPGASVFGQRAAGLARSNGEVVAVTEDHCWVRPGWCRRIIAAHAEHDDVAVIAGSMENGATEFALDRALFAMTAAPFVAPIGPELGGPPPTAANISLKRRALGPGPLGEGWLEFIFARDAFLAGDCVVEEDIRIVHDKPFGRVGAIRAVYHNARSSSGLVIATLSPIRRVRRLARAVLVMPVSLTITALRRARAKPSLRSDVRGLAAIPVLVLVQVAGEIAGLVRGAGASPGHVV